MACKGSDLGACELRRAVGYGLKLAGLQSRGGCMAAKFVLKKGSTGKFRYNV